jgi:hypothetical protein
MYFVFHVFVWSLVRIDSPGPSAIARRLRWELVFITFASFHCERDPALGCLAVIHMHAPQEAREGDALVAPETKDGTAACLIL